MSPTATSSLALCAAASIEEAALASAIEVVGADGKVKTTFTAIPFGDPIQGRDGRSWRMVNADHAARVLAATRSRLGNVEMALNYDHQPELAIAQGGTAPASGWVKDLKVGTDGIEVTVEWTPKAEAAIAAREYRYMSPSFMHDQAGNVTRLNNIALTNNPNFDLPALAHQEQRKTGEVPDMRKITLSLTTAICAALAIKADDADEAQIAAAIVQLKTGKDGADTALNAVRSQLGVAEDADQETVLASLDTAKQAGAPDPSKYVPKDGYDALAAKVAKIEEARVLASVDAAVAAGKLTPSMKQWAIDLGKKDEPALAAFIDQATPFVGTAKVEGDPKPEKGKLTAEEKAICSQLGLSEADFLKTREVEAH